MKIFFEKVSCNVLPLTYNKQLLYLPKHVLFLSYDINFSVEGYPFRVASLSLFFVFSCFQLSILVGLIGIKIFFTLL